MSFKNSYLQSQIPPFCYVSSQKCDVGFMMRKGDIGFVMMGTSAVAIM